MEIFSEGKIEKIKEMGFTNEEIIKDALRQVSGNVALAIEKLVSGAVQPRPCVEVLKDDEEPAAASSCTKSLAPIFTASQKPAALSQTSQRGRAPAKDKMNRMGRNNSKVIKSVSMVSFPSISRDPSRNTFVKREREQEEAGERSAATKQQEEGVHVIAEEQEQEDREDQACKRRRPADYERRPLAERMRPEDVKSIIGQRDVSDAIRKFLLAGSIPSIILWGPPGCGKSTLGKIVSRAEGYCSVFLSAVNSGLADVKRIVREAQTNLSLHGRKTILFLDEIHRFNKIQQDAFLPHVESGLITLIGATTENPSFSLNRALLSRCQVYSLKRLEDGEVKNIIIRALNDRENGLTPALQKLHEVQERSHKPAQVSIEPQALDAVIKLADGDARAALNFIEVSMSHAVERRRSGGEEGRGEDAGRTRAAVAGVDEEGAMTDSPPSKQADSLHESSQTFDTPPSTSNKPRSSSSSSSSASDTLLISLDDVRKATLDQTTVAYDAHGDEHYNCISAFHKSIRGSDPQAAVRQQRGEEGHELKGSQIYWLARMLEGGESPEVCAVCLEQEGNESLQYVARRMIRIASEDVGLADTSALVQATATLEAVKAIGMPECNLALCQCAVFLACCPKCNALYSAYKSAVACVHEEPNYPVPLHLRNATSKMLSDLGWGKGYKYNHDYPAGCEQDYLPPELVGRRFLTVEPARKREASPAL